MSKILDLHHLKFNSPYEIEEKIYHKLDNFLHPFLKKHTSSHTIKVEIVVGKGLNSTNFIEGKNPLRFYVEKYLNKLGIEWQNSYDRGAIFVWF